MFKDNGKIIIFCLIVVFFIIIGVSYARSPELLTKEITTNIIRLDEDAYGSNVFDSSNLDFRPILDKDVSKDSNNVVYISFRVGGAEVNDADDIIYDIALAELEVDCNLLSPYLKWRLFKNGENISEGSFDYKFDTIKKGRLVLTSIQQDLVDYSEDKSDYDYYEFYMWLSSSCQSENLLECLDSENQEYLTGKIQGKIEVELYTGIKKALVRNPSNELDLNTCIGNDLSEDNNITEQKEDS